MKSKHLKKRLSYFKALRGLCKKDIKQYMLECEDQLIHVICEACFNLCHHHAVKDEEITCKEREPFDVYIKKLANEKVPVEYKREILQKIGAEIVYLIDSSIIPLLKEKTKNL